MENVSNRISYLRGLMAGLKIDPETNEAKIFDALVDALDEINDTLDDLYDYQDEIAQTVDLIDDDLAEVETVATRTATVMWSTTNWSAPIAAMSSA